jgi:lipid-binding SYLF domain-containing protein
MRFIATTAAVLIAAAPAAYALDNGSNKPVPPVQHGSQANSPAARSGGSTTTGAAPAKQQNNSAQQLVNQAVKVVKKMESDKQLAGLMKKAKGLFIVPEFGRGAVIVGGRGGAGLVTVRQNGKWSDPAFYDFGGVSLGPQIGASGGAVVFLLMDQTAVDAFKSGNKFSLNAGAGLSIVNYSGGSQASWGKGDIVMWTDTSGAYVGATASVTDINWSDSNNRAYYGKKTDMTQILNGAVTNASANELTSALPD